MVIKSKIEKLEISDIIKIYFRPGDRDIGETIPVIGFLSRKDQKKGTIYLTNGDPRYKHTDIQLKFVEWYEKEYSINRIESLFKIAPLGKKEPFVKCLI